MSVIVHFGMPKTGSSSIQASLFRHLEDPKFRYVAVSGANQNEALVSLFKAKPEHAQMHRRKVHAADDVGQLRTRHAAALDRELAAAADKTAIISAEAISTFKRSELAQLRQSLARWSPVVRAVGYVRSPKAFMESAFQQQAKGPTCRFDPGALMPKYKERLRLFDAVFGRSNVELWKFDPSVFPGGDVVLDFCARLGVSFSPESVIRVNDGLSLPAVALLYTYRKYGQGYGSGVAAVRENRLLVDAMSKLPGAVLRLHSGLVEPVIAQNHAQIAWMEERLGTSLSEDLAADDHLAVRSEADLLTYAPDTLMWLAERVGPDCVERCGGEVSPQDVADWMHRLRRKLAAGDARLNRVRADRRPPMAPAAAPRPDKRTLSLLTLVEDLRRADPRFGRVPEELAVGLLRQALDQIGRSVDQLEHGSLKVDALGEFKATSIDKEGAAGARIKKTLFGAAVPAVGKGAGVSPAGLIPRIQESNATRYNRYKEVFEAVRKSVLPAEPEKILSFGCSTGDEPLSLAELWFPKSRILGLDVSDECLVAAREKTRGVSDRVEIAHSSQAIIDAWAPFDVIFAMSVLCAWPASKPLDDISLLYRFDEFERNVGMLGCALKKDGLLVIWNASFRFGDTQAAGDFEPIPVDGVEESGFVKKFGPDNKALAVQDYPLFIFRKVR